MNYPTASHHLRRGMDKADWISLVLAFLMLPMLWAEYVIGVAAATRSLFHAYFLFLWALFSLEFILRLWRAQNRLAYLRHNWIEVVIVFFPFLRLLRLFRPLELAIILISHRVARSFPGFRANAFFNLIVAIVVVIAISSELILFFEAGQPESPVKNFGDALWWSTIGVSTIGLGNVVPVSAAGKALTLALTITGVLAFSILTAQIADLFITEERIQKAVQKGSVELASGESKILDKLDHIESRLEDMEKEHHTAASDAAENPNS